MSFFKKQELIILSLIFIIVIAVSLGNFRSALRRARDVQRKNDMRLISNLVEQYHADYGFFPPSDDNGRIKGCFKIDVLEEFIEENESVSSYTKFDRDSFFDKVLESCEWGESPLPEPSLGNNNYIDVLPRDPKADLGIKYKYISNGDLYQVYTYLEGGRSEAEYNKKIVSRGLDCGSGRNCNFGLAYGATPLDKSLEEYQNELIRQ